MGSLLASLVSVLAALLVGCGAEGHAVSPGRTLAPRELNPGGAGVRSSQGAHAVKQGHRAAAASAQPESKAPPNSGALLGTAGPVIVEGVGANGHWATVCQARVDTDNDGKLAVYYGPRGELLGDSMESYFVLGSGPGEAVDALLAQDGSGRHVVISVKERLILVDTLTGKRTDLTALGADDRSDASAYLPHRSLTFDPAGSRLAYLRREPGTHDSRRRGSVVVRDLSSGAEHGIDAGPGEPWRIRFSPDGSRLVFQVVAEDTNGNGRLEWPVPEVKVNRWRCRGPIPRFPVWNDYGDRPVVRVASVDAGEARYVVGWVSSFGDSDLVRDAGGRLLMARTDGRVVLTERECGGVVLYADPLRRLALAACAAETTRAPVWLVGPGLRRDLQIDVQPTSVDYLPERLTRLVALYPGAGTVLVDMERRSLTELTPGDDVVATSGAVALVRRGTELVAYDAETGRERKLAGPLEAFGSTLLAGSVAFVPPFVVRMPESGTGKAAPAEPSVLGSAPGAVLGLEQNGHVLLPATPPSDDAPAGGPLHWVVPVR